MQLTERRLRETIAKQARELTAALAAEAAAREARDAEVRSRSDLELELQEATQAAQVMGGAMHKAAAAAAAAMAAGASTERLDSLEGELSEARQAQLTCQLTAEAEAASKRQVLQALHQSKAALSKQRKQAEHAPPNPTYSRI